MKILDNTIRKLSLNKMKKDKKDLTQQIKKILK